MIIIEKLIIFDQLSTWTMIYNILYLHGNFQSIFFYFKGISAAVDASKIYFVLPILPEIQSLKLRLAEVSTFYMAWN